MNNNVQSQVRIYQHLVSQNDPFYKTDFIITHSFSANNLIHIFTENPHALNSNLNPDVTKIMFKYHPHTLRVVCISERLITADSVQQKN